MANSIVNTYSIYVDSFISDIEKAKEVFPVASSLSTYSFYEYSSEDHPDGDNIFYFGSNEIGQYFWALRKNPNEVPRRFYRNGILADDALISMVHNGKLHVSPGEYKIKGDPRYLGYASSINYMTDVDSDINLSIDMSVNTAALNIISAYVAMRGMSNQMIVSAPKDQASVDTPAEPKEYIGFDFKSDLTDLLVNNFIQNKTDTGSVIKFKPSNPDASFVWASSEPYLFCEYLGRADGSINQVFNTKFFPISAPGIKDSDYSDGLTRVLVVTEGTSVFYKVSDSYMEALDDGDFDGCFVDRQKGKIFFGRKPIQTDSYLEVDATINSGNTFTNITIPDGLGDLFEDIGYLTVTDNVNADKVKFCKISPYQIQIQQSTYSYSGTLKIYPANLLTLPEGEVYAFYTVTMALQGEQANTYRQMNSEDLKPWLWSGQQTIAVLSKDKAYALNIRLRAIDVPFIKQASNSVFTYGPLHSGSELVFLEGTVNGDNEEPVVNQEVTITVVQGAGTLNGDSMSTNVITDDNGQFYVAYDPNASRNNWLFFKDSDIVSFSGKTFLNVNPAYNSSENIPTLTNGKEEAILYTIRKDDGTLGTVGKKYTVNASSVSGTPASDYVGEPFFLADRLLSVGTKGLAFYDFLREEEIAQYIHGKVTVKYESSPGVFEYVSVSIKDIAKHPEIWWNYGTESWDFVNLDQRLSTYAIVLDDAEEDLWLSLSGITEMWFITKNDIEYSSSMLNGRKVIIAERKTSKWKHPAVENYLPVYGPIMTSWYDTTGKRFIVESVLPASSSTDRDVNIAGYAILPDREVILQASTFNEDKLIYSNKVAFEIELNDRDKGVVENVLKTLKVPYGFRLRDSYSEVSSTISFSTFLTVNKVPGTSFGDVKYPVISYLGTDGIIYVENNNEQVAYQASSSAVDFTINIQE